MAQKKSKSGRGLKQKTTIPESINHVQNVSGLLQFAATRPGPVFGISWDIRTLQDRRIPELQKSKLNVLIEGETGTGKEEVADQIMAYRPEPAVPHVKVNCAAIPKDFVESELYGYKKGAFSGAVTEKIGLLKEAKGGYLFLDEFGEFSEEQQAKLLRVLQGGEYYPLGASKAVKIGDVRIIVAVQDRTKLRDDVFWRFPEKIKLTPLCTRREDAFVILHCLLPGLLEKDENENVEWMISPTSMLSMLLSPWPGNVRELVNAAEISVDRWRHWFKGASPYRVPFFYAPDGATHLSLGLEIIPHRNWMKISDHLRKNDLKSLIKEDYGKLGFSQYYMETGQFSPALNPAYFLSLSTILELFEKSYEIRHPETRRRKKGSSTTSSSEFLLAGNCTNKISSVVRDIGEYWDLSQDVREFYSASKSTESLPSTDLTQFTLDELTREYYNLLVRKHGSPKNAAEAAGVHKDTITRFLNSQKGLQSAS